MEQFLQNSRLVGKPPIARRQIVGKDLPLADFGVQRPIELVEKELQDTAYYTREVVIPAVPVSGRSY